MDIQACFSQWEAENPQTAKKIREVLQTEEDLAETLLENEKSVRNAAGQLAIKGDRGALAFLEYLRNVKKTYNPWTINESEPEFIDVMIDIEFSGEVFLVQKIIFLKNLLFYKGSLSSRIIGVVACIWSPEIQQGNYKIINRKKFLLKCKKFILMEKFNGVFYRKIDPLEKKTFSRHRDELERKIVNLIDSSNYFYNLFIGFIFNYSQSEHLFINDLYSESLIRPCNNFDLTEKGDLNTFSNEEFCFLFNLVLEKKGGVPDSFRIRKKLDWLNP